MRSCATRSFADNTTKMLLRFCGEGVNSVSSVAEGSAALAGGTRLGVLLDGCSGRWGGGRAGLGPSGTSIEAGRWPAAGCGRLIRGEPAAESSSCTGGEGGGEGGGDSPGSGANRHIGLHSALGVLALRVLALRVRAHERRTGCRPDLSRTRVKGTAQKKMLIWRGASRQGFTALNGPSVQYSKSDTKRYRNTDRIIRARCDRTGSSTRTRRNLLKLCPDELLHSEI